METAHESVMVKIEGQVIAVSATRDGRELLKPDATVINEREAKELLMRHKANGSQFFSVVFLRVNKKCQHCDKSTKKMNQYVCCPTCGDELSILRNMVCNFGVQNPTGDLKPGTGKYNGEGFAEAWENGRVKVFDPNAEGQYGRGGYRQFAVSHLLQITVNGMNYRVAHDKIL